MHPALVELRLDLRDVSQLGRANRCVILGVRKQDRRAVADPIMEIDLTLSGLGRKIRSYIT